MMHYDIDVGASRDTFRACGLLLDHVDAAGSTLEAVSRDAPGVLPHSPFVAACFAEYMGVGVAEPFGYIRGHVDEAITAGQVAVGCYVAGDNAMGRSTLATAATVADPDYLPGRFTSEGR